MSKPVQMAFVVHTFLVFSKGRRKRGSGDLPLYRPELLHRLDFA
jgi:hypothetical protein